MRVLFDVVQIMALSQSDGVMDILPYNRQDVVKKKGNYRLSGTSCVKILQSITGSMKCCPVS